LFKFWTLCIFEPHFGGLGTTYDVYLGLIGKRVVDFLLLLIELFSLGVTAEALRAKIAVTELGSFDREGSTADCRQFDSWLLSVYVSV